MPAFREVLDAVERVLPRDRRDEISRARQAARSTRSAASRPTARDEFARAVDARRSRRRASRSSAASTREYGGFGGAPKFPHPTTLELLLRALARAASGDRRAARSRWSRTRSTRWRRAASTTSWAAASAATASTRDWSIPHFEKMLYDNGAAAARSTRTRARRRGEPLLRARRERDRGLGHARHAGAARRLLLDARRGLRARGRQVLRLDAEPKSTRCSTAEEGGAREARLRPRRAPPNFEGKHWHLHVAATPEAGRRRRSGCDVAATPTLLEARAREAARRARDSACGRAATRRCSTSWNGLMIAGMARAARVLGAARACGLRDARASISSAPSCGATGGCTPRTRTAARGSRRISTTTRSCSRPARAAAGRLARRRPRLRARARRRAARALRGPRAAASSSRPTITSADPQAEAVRRQGDAGRATASPRCALVAARPLARRAAYLDAAERAVRAGAARHRALPEAHATLLRALEELLEPPKVVVLRGTAEELAPWRPSSRRTYEPHRLAFAIPNDAKLSGLLRSARARGASRGLRLRRDDLPRAASSSREGVAL